MKVKVCSPDGDTDFFDIVTGVLRGGILASYQFIICLAYVFRKSVDLIKDNGFMLAKARSRRHPAQTITYVNYVDDRALLANTKLHRLEWAVGGKGFHVNTDKTEFMSFNQRGDIFSLNDRSLKLVDKCTYLGSSVSSTENDINTQLAKAWTAINSLSVIWKSDLSDKIKRIFFKQQLCQYYCMDAPHGHWLNIWRESLATIAQECRELYWTSPGGSIPQCSSCTDTYYPSWKPFKLDKQDMQDTAREVRVSS